MKAKLFIMAALVGMFMVQACRAPTPPQPTSTPVCVEVAWSYSENTTTEIEINSDLTITMETFYPDMLTRSFMRNTTTIHGDGSAVVVNQQYIEGEPQEKTRVEKQLSTRQLEQIVQALEQANFYAIRPGCRGVFVTVSEAWTLDISVETNGRLHAIQDNGACAVYDFKNYCSLRGKIEAILDQP
jgi:hypothetical protein